LQERNVITCPGHVWHLTHRCHKGGLLDTEHCNREPIVCGGCQEADAQLRDRPSCSEEGRRLELRESQLPYKAFFDTGKNDIEGKNLWFWNE